MDAPNTSSASGTATDVGPQIAAEVAALLSFNSDVLYPSVGADVASISSFVDIITGLQLRCESDPAFRDAALGGESAARVFEKLALWLATWPSCDNVVAGVAIIAYLVSLSPGGCRAAARAEMGPVNEADAERRRQHSTGASAQQSFVLRLVFSAHAVSGSESPANSMIAAARCSSFIQNLVQHCAATRDELLLTQTLELPLVLSFLCATVATFADRPNPDVFCGPRAANEARIALESYVTAEIAFHGQRVIEGSMITHDHQDSLIERSFVALFRIPVAVSSAIDTCAFTPGGAAALAEIVRNSIAKVMALINPYFRRSEELYVDETFFCALGEPLWKPAVVITRLISSLFSGIVRCSWMSSLARLDDRGSGGVHAGLVEHLLAACFNMSTCPQLRDALCFSAPGYASDLRQLLRCGLNGISQFNRLTPAGVPFTAPVATAMCIIAKVLTMPLSETPMFASALSAHFSDAGGFRLIAELIENRSGVPLNDATSREVVLAAVAVAHAHLRTPGAVRAERGTTVSLCVSLVHYLEQTFISRRRAPNEAEVIGFMALASRVSYMPPSAFGAFPLTVSASGGDHGRGDDPAEWPTAAQNLADKIDEAMNPDPGAMAAAA